MRSKFEERFAIHLKTIGVPYKYEAICLEYYLPRRGRCSDCGGTKTEVQRWYIPDWQISSNVYIETKGKFTSSDRSKMLAVKMWWPSLDIRLVFMADNWTTKKHTMRYSDWCKRKGFNYYVGFPPKTWFKERSNSRKMS